MFQFNATSTLFTAVNENKRERKRGVRAVKS